MGTTIGNILLSYDVETNHTPVKDAMKNLGYMDTWKLTDTSPIYHLPNTTLWHNKKSSDGAISDLKQVCSNLNVKLEKAVAVRASEFSGV